MNAHTSDDYTSRLSGFRDLIERHASPAAHNQTTAIPSVGLMHLKRPLMPARQTRDLLFYMVAGGGKTMVIGERTVDLRPGDYVVSVADLGFVSGVAHASDADPYLGVAVRLDPVRALSAARTLGLAQPQPAADTYVGTGAKDSGPIEATFHLLKLLDDPDDIPSLAPLFEQELVYRLLRSEIGPALLNLVSGVSPEMRISRIIDAITRNYAERLDLETLARTNGFSPSSFFRHFRQATSLSPIQYQKRVRLRSARQMMLAGEEDATGAAFRVGYGSLTQFTREYKRAFGLPPARDITRLKSSRGDLALAQTPSSRPAMSPALRHFSSSSSKA